MSIFNRTPIMPTAEMAPRGRNEPVTVSPRHFVSQRAVVAPFPAGSAIAIFGLGCFWGAERKFWQTQGVYSTSVGYCGGFTVNPTYEEVCTGLTGHNEVVQVVFEPSALSYADLLQVFWESHDPTQGMRQGNDVGTQYRSGIYTRGADQQAAAEASRVVYGAALMHAGLSAITTEIIPATVFYYAEDYHQQYLAKNPNGYCGIGGCGVPFKLAELQVGEKA